MTDAMHDHDHGTSTSSMAPAAAVSGRKVPKSSPQAQQHRVTANQRHVTSTECSCSTRHAALSGFLEQDLDALRRRINVCDSDTHVLSDRMIQYMNRMDARHRALIDAQRSELERKLAADHERLLREWTVECTRLIDEWREARERQGHLLLRNMGAESGGAVSGPGQAVNTSLSTAPPQLSKLEAGWLDTADQLFDHNDRWFARRLEFFRVHHEHAQRARSDWLQGLKLDLGKMKELRCHVDKEIRVRFQHRQLRLKATRNVSEQSIRVYQHLRAAQAYVSHAIAFHIALAAGPLLRRWFLALHDQQHYVNMHVALLVEMERRCRREMSDLETRIRSVEASSGSSTGASSVKPSYITPEEQRQTQLRSLTEQLKVVKDQLQSAVEERHGVYRDNAPMLAELLSFLCWADSMTGQDQSAVSAAAITPVSDLLPCLQLPLDQAREEVARYQLNLQACIARAAAHSVTPSTSSLTSALTVEPSGVVATTQPRIIPARMLTPGTACSPYAVPQGSTMGSVHVGSLEMGLLASMPTARPLSIEFPTVYLSVLCVAQLRPDHIRQAIRRHLHGLSRLLLPCHPTARVNDFAQVRASGATEERSSQHARVTVSASTDGVPARSICVQPCVTTDIRVSAAGFVALSFNLQ